MVEFKKENDEYILLIQDNRVVIDKEKVDKKEFLAIIVYLNEAQSFEQAEIFYNSNEQEIDSFLLSVQDGIQFKYALDSEIFPTK